MVTIRVDFNATSYAVLYADKLECIYYEKETQTFLLSPVGHYATAKGFKDGVIKEASKVTIDFEGCKIRADK